MDTPGFILSFAFGVWSARAALRRSSLFIVKIAAGCVLPALAFLGLLTGSGSCVLIKFRIIHFVVCHNVPSVCA
jgi:hypothetical protein